MDNREIAIVGVGPANYPHFEPKQENRSEIMRNYAEIYLDKNGIHVEDKPAFFLLLDIASEQVYQNVEERLFLESLSYHTGTVKEDAFLADGLAAFRNLEQAAAQLGNSVVYVINELVMLQARSFVEHTESKLFEIGKQLIDYAVKEYNLDYEPKNLPFQGKKLSHSKITSYGTKSKQRTHFYKGGKKYFR